MMQGQGMDLRRDRIQECAAMFAGDLPLSLQPFQILPDRGFGHLKGLGEVADPCCAFLLNPFQDAPAPGL